MLEEFSCLGEKDCYQVVIQDPNLVAGWCGQMDICVHPCGGDRKYSIGLFFIPLVKWIGGGPYSDVAIYTGGWSRLSPSLTDWV